MFQEIALRRGCGRRWTSLKQNPRSETEQLTKESSTPSTNTASPQPAVPRKSNWQVIEHFGSTNKGSLSASLLTVSTQFDSYRQKANRIVETCVKYKSNRNLVNEHFRYFILIKPCDGINQNRIKLVWHY